MKSILLSTILIISSTVISTSSELTLKDVCNQKELFLTPNYCQTLLDYKIEQESKKISYKKGFEFSGMIDGIVPGGIGGSSSSGQ